MLFDIKALDQQWLLTTGISTIFAIILANIIYGARPLHTYQWHSFPWIGLRKQWFARIRAHFRTITSVRGMTEVGYEQHSRHGRAFAVSQFGNDPWIVLPPSKISELLEKSDQDVSARFIHQEQMHVDYTIGPIAHHVMTYDTQFDVLRRQITRKLPVLISDMYDEIVGSFQRYWSDEQEWHSVFVFDTCTKIVARSANRVLAGVELCRNEDFLEHSRLNSWWIFTGASFIQLIPRWMRSTVAPIVMFPNRRHKRICVNACVPVIEKRLSQTVDHLKSPDSIWEPPNDGLQWVIEEALRSGDIREIDPHMITERLLLLNITAIHTTSFTITDTVLNVWSSADAKFIVDSLREECTRVLAKHDGTWTKTAVNELYRIDSTIRESMRFTDLNFVAMPRMVTAPGGVDFSGNIHVPAGARVGVPSHAIHRDESVYETPYSFDPFRFSRLREGLDPGDQSNGSETLPSSTTTDNHETHKVFNTEQILRSKKASLVTTTDSFFGFGHGRHACPGRFLAAQTLKLMLAHLVLYYEVEVLDKRPPNQIIIGLSLTPESAQIRIRRRGV